MACNTLESDKDAEWPALNAVASATDGRHQKNVQAKSKDSKCVNGHNSSKENKESINKNAGALKKKNSKIMWQPLQIEMQPYRKKGAGRFFNESTKSADYDKNYRSRYESSNNFDSGRGNYRNGGFKVGKRGRAYANYRSHQEEEFVTSETTSCGGIIINGVTFFPQTFSDATRKNFLKRQMEYYFSDINLVSDVYLRLRMDNLGFVPLNIFLNFPRIMPLTRDINILADAVEESNKLELSNFNYQLYVRRIVDPLGWKIRNPYVDDIEIPFDDPYSNILPETPENMSNGDETCVKSSDEADLTAESASENGSNHDEVKSNSFPDETNSDNATSNKEACVAPVSEDDSNVSAIVHQIETLSLTADASLALNTLHLEPVNAQFVPSLTEESSNAISPVTASPSECDIELSGVYIDSKAINNGCDYFSTFSESVEQVDGRRFFSENVYNDVIFYESNELSNQRPMYYMVNSREVLSTSSDNSNEEVFHLSPEPSR